MAINFPDSPAENEQYTVGDRTWTWNGTYWELSTSTSTFTAGDSEPVDADPGDIWFDSTIGKTFVNYSGTWVEIGNAATVVDVIADADADTKVQVEVTADSDKIEFTTAGTKRLEIDASGHVIPAANETYDLGSALNRFRDLYLSGSSIDLGGVSITSDGSNISLPNVDDIAASSVTVAGENVTPYTGRRNLLYNGAMQVAQRGTSSAGVAGLAYYTADRWKTWVNAMGAFTQSVDSNAPDGYGASLKMLCSTADASPASGDFIVLSQIMEGQDLQGIKKGTSSAEQLTVSFWVKSNLTGTYVVEFVDNDNQRFVSGSYTVSSSDVWERKTITFPADTSGVMSNSNGGSLTLQFFLGAGSNFQSASLQTSWNGGGGRASGQVNLASAVNNYWQVTGVQLEVGDKATPFEHRSYGEELALCQRYYYKPPQHYYSTIAYGNWVDFTAFLRATMPIGVAMRANPSVTYSSYLIYGNGGSGFTGSGTIYTYGQNSGQLVLGFGHAGTGMGSANIGIVVAPSGMEISAEL